MSGDSRHLFLFLGAPGSGKGTLSKCCIDSFGFEQLSTGNLLREHVARGSEIGKKIDLALKSGKLIDDNLVSEMVIDNLMAHPGENVILDGYPRTVIQAEVFDRFIQEKNKISPSVIRLHVTEQTVIDRLSMRLICSREGCQAVYSLAPGSPYSPRGETKCDLCAAPLVRRGDDDVESIRKRLQLYHIHESALLDFYNKQGYHIVELDASQSIDRIFEEFKNKMGDFA